jgi:hypothetical protein
VLCFYGDSDPTSHIEGSPHPTPMRLEGLNQVIEDGIGNVFMKHALVAVRPQIQFEGFGFEDFLVGDVLDGDRCEVWLLGCGAYTSKLVRFQTHYVSAPRVMVWKSFQLLARVSIAAEQCQTL